MKNLCKILFLVLIIAIDSLDKLRRYERKYIKLNL